MLFYFSQVGLMFNIGIYYDWPGDHPGFSFCWKISPNKPLFALLKRHLPRGLVLLKKSINFISDDSLLKNCI